MTHPNTTRTVKDEEVEKAANEAALLKYPDDAIDLGNGEKINVAIVTRKVFVEGWNEAISYAYSHPDTAQLVAFGELVLTMAANQAYSVWLNDDGLYATGSEFSENILSLKSRLKQMAEEFKGGKG